LIVPKKQLKSRLIEGPIEIKRPEKPPFADVKEVETDTGGFG
jgi:hypothetical protein